MNSGKSKMFVLPAALLFFPLAGLSASQPTPPPALDIRQFGAVGDGKALDTPAIQAGLDQCGKAGGGVVRLPKGTYRSQPLFFRASNTTLELEAGATLLGTDEPQDYRDSSSHQHGPAAPVVGLVNAQGLTNIAIIGPGAIDGSGARWWPEVKQAKQAGQPDPRRRPRMVVFSGCKGVRVLDITLQNSPSFHLVPIDCDDVLIERVTIKAPPDSPNTDAIDPSVSRNVRIANCLLDVGDDNVALKSGRSRAGRPGCENIVVSNCTFLHGHGMSIGSETAGGVNGLRVQNCTFADTVSGLRIKSARGKGGAVENVSYRDITMKNVKFPIDISCYYPKVPAHDVAQALNDRTPVFRDIHIGNLTASSPNCAGRIIGLPESKVSGVFLENVTIEAPAGLTIQDADNVRLDHVKIQTQHGEPLLIHNAQVQKL